jgi:hypothetical protein
MRRKIPRTLWVHFLCTPTCIQFRDVFIGIITSWTPPLPDISIHANRSIGRRLKTLICPFLNAAQVKDRPAALAVPHLCFSRNTAVANHAFIGTISDISVDSRSNVLGIFKMLV